MSVGEITEGLDSAISSDGSLNHITIYEATRVIGRVASLVVGFLTVVIIILVPFVVGLEIIYICFPIIRNKTDDLISKLEAKGMAGKTIGFTFRDAKQSVFLAETTEVGTNPLWIYLKIKCKSIMFLMLVLSLIVQGSDTIINIVWNLISRIVSTIFG
jgi:hypothetical protein